MIRLLKCTAFATLLLLVAFMLLYETSKVEEDTFSWLK